MSIDKKFIKFQISRTILSGGCFGSWLVDLLRKKLKNVAIPFASDNVPGLVNNLASTAINKFENKASEKRAVKKGKRIISLILNFLKS